MAEELSRDGFMYPWTEDRIETSGTGEHEGRTNNDLHGGLDRVRVKRFKVKLVEEEGTVAEVE